MAAMKPRRTRQSVGDQLRRAFEQSGMTRYELAKRSSIPYSTIHRFMAGERDIVLSTIEKLCEVLQLELRPIKPKGR